MTKPGQLFVGLTAALPAWFTANSAYAQNFHSWVSSTGTGTACTRAAPCADFSAAQDATFAGGVISVLDQGGNDSFFVVVIKSLTIRAEGVDGGATSIPGSGF